MASAAFVRLGPTSAKLSEELDAAAPGSYKDSITLTCAQVPSQFQAGSPIWLWLGSDNNKGQGTSWVQGIRAYGICEKSERIEGSKSFEVVLRDVYLLPRTITKLELLQSSPETYARSLADAAIIGLDNYASQVVQILSDDEFATIGAMIADMIPESKEELVKRVPAIAGVKLIARPEDQDGSTGNAPVEKPEKEPPPYTCELESDDAIFEAVRQLIDDDGFGGILLQGPPGTGKSWYAKQIAIKLTDGERRRIRQVQFHPSYQYEDFVEGYVPRGSTGFRLQDKHLLEMVEIAKSTDKPVIIVIDEFSRTDPARVLGEAMTYMEKSLRGQEFSLPSGRSASIPANLIFIATMNPDDRSVDEIDDAMDRRWAKVHLSPDVKRLRSFLQTNKTPGPMIGAVIEFFNGIQEYVPIGHAFFRTVGTAQALQRLWDNQLQYVVQKKFRFDPDTRQTVSALWEKCIAACAPKEAEPASAEAPAAPVEAAPAAPAEAQPGAGA